MYNIKRFLLVSIIVISGFNVFSQTEIDTAKIKMLNTIDIINNYYVDKVSKNEIVENAIIGALKKLDPHSVYFTKEEIKKANEPLEGSFEGIGVQFNLLNDTMIVISPISGGPSDKLGILPGDKFVKVNDTSFVGEKLTNSKVLETLRGKKGTIVKVTVYRKGEKDLLEFEIVRDKIPIYSIDASYMIKPKIGYIKINRFASSTMTEFKESLSKLQLQGMENLILDLTGNSGGYLGTSISLADQFLGKGKTIVYTEDRTGNKDYNTATSNGLFEKGKLVVLIDEGSASASEIVSGAIQDWDRGIIVGRRSFGKGLVQKPFDLIDGSSIRLTIAKYYTPSGRCIQKPYVEGNDEYNKDIYTRYKHGELFSKDSIKLPDSLKFYTNNKRVVYGGGGIMPDIFIPIDTTEKSKYHTNLLRKGVLNKFVLDFVDRNRNTLISKYNNIDNFVNQFEIDDDIFNQFIVFAEKNGVEKEETDINTSKNLIKYQLKALFSQNIWEKDGYFMVINDINNLCKKAIEIIESSTFDELKIKY